MRPFLAALLLCVFTAAPAQDRTFDSGGVRIRYVEAGAGTPVVLVHGFTGDLERTWIHTGILAALEREYRVIALDLRGHGRSGKPHAPAAYDDIAEDVVRLLDHLGIARAHLVGYSLGGIIAAKLVTVHPQRFRSAVLAAASHRRGRGREIERATEAAATELTGGIPYRTLILSTAPSDELPPAEDAIRRVSAELLARNDPLAHAALYRARRALVIADRELAASPVPILAIVGEHDPARPRVQAMRARCPSVQVVVIDGATHSARDTRRGLAWRPEFIAHLRAFLAAHPG